MPKPMRMRMRVACSRMLAAALLALALEGAVSAADDRIPLLVRPLDEVHLKNGAPMLAGRITEVIDGISIKLRKPGSPSEMVVPWRDIDHIDRKQSAQDAVAGRGAQDLQAGDVNHLKTTIKWGIDNGAKDAAILLAKQAVDKRASPDLAEMVVPLLEEQDDLDGVVSLVSPLLDADPQWTFGYETLARTYQKQNKDGELGKLVDRWLMRQPAAQTPNRYRAVAAELGGDLITAQEAYRKGFDLHQDYESGLGYARTSLKRGAYPEALATCDALIQAAQAGGSAAKAAPLVDDARAIAGCAQLALGDAAKAEPLLAQAVGGKPSAEMAAIARYDLGLIAYRSGRPDFARQQWQGLSLPAADLGLAMIARQPYSRAKDLPGALKAIALESNACVDLENKRYDQALAALDPRSSRRQAFLAQLAALKIPNDDAVRAVAATPGPESLRWQVYGHILTRRWAQAEAALNQLPPGDGYAAVCRVYLAEARRDTAGARAAFAAVRESIDPPREYVEELAHQYEAANDQLQIEHFEGATADLTARDWKFSQQSTGIQVRTADNRLVLEGTQSAGDDLFTRVYKVAPATQTHSIEATIDLVGVNGAVCGIEMLDLGRANGIAFGVLPDNHLGWRQQKDGVWTSWQPLPVMARSSQVLRLELERGTVIAVSPDEPAMRKPIATGMFKDQAELHVGLFGTADAGVAWSLGVREFKLQLRPLPKPGAAR
jgi:hypothetical protein